MDVILGRVQTAVGRGTHEQFIHPRVDSTHSRTVYNRWQHQLAKLSTGPVSV
jgi:hypothetical protein